MKFSDCCGAVDRPTDIDGPSWEDIGFCPECKDHCEYAEAEDDLPEWELAEIERADIISDRYQIWRNEI